MLINIVSGTLIVPLATLLTIYVHLGVVWAAVASISFTAIYAMATIFLLYHTLFPASSISGRASGIFGIFINSERAILVLIGLLALNYLAFYSPQIEAFIEKATQ